MYQKSVTYQVPLLGQHIETILEALETKKRLDAVEVQKAEYAINMLQKFEYSDAKELTDKKAK